MRGAIGTSNPSFPLHALVPWQRAMVEEAARVTKTDPALAAMVSLGVISGAVARKAVVEVSPSYSVPLHLWLLIALRVSGGASR